MTIGLGPHRLLRKLGIELEIPVVQHGHGGSWGKPRVLDLNQSLNFSDSVSLCLLNFNIGNNNAYLSKICSRLRQ
jgi:hypothetical protein